MAVAARAFRVLHLFVCLFLHIGGNQRETVDRTRSYSLSSYEAIVRDAKRARSWSRKNWYWIAAILVCVGVGAAIGIYYGGEMRFISAFVLVVSPLNPNLDPDSAFTIDLDLP